MAVPEKDAERTRTITWRDPVAAARAGAAMGGLEYLRAIQAGALPPPPMMATLGIGVDVLDEGRVVFFCDPQEYHYNPIGAVHGGLAATLCDTAAACAVHAMLPPGTGYTTLEIKVNFVRPISRDTGRIFCEGTVIHAGGRVATSEAHLRDAQGALYAHATSTCMIFRPSRGGVG